MTSAMTWFFFILCGLLCGRIVHAYIHNFAHRLNREIYTAYVEIYPENPPHFDEQKSVLQPLNLNFSVYFYSFFFAALFMFCYAINADLLKAICLALYCTLLIAISITDWHYQLVSPTLCQTLFAIGLCSAYWQIGALTLERSLQSAVIFFSVFYAVYQLAKWSYRQEALGRGDYWLALGLGAFLPLQQLPLFAFLACLFGLMYAGYGRYRKYTLNAIPFAPFLSLSGLVCLLLN